MKSDLNRAIDEFTATPMAAGKAMRDLFRESDPQAFLEAAIPFVRSSPERPGTQYLLTLLLLNDLILTPLIDPAIFSFDEAIAIARQLVKIEPILDIKMMRRLLESRGNTDDLYKRVDNTKGIRLLEIMAAVSDGARILPVMSQLLRHSNPKIRSKAALLVGRTNKNCKWVEQRLGESDPRVRANAVESLWGLESPDAKSVFWGAVNDPDNRVAGNALMGLYRLGEPASIPLMVDMLSHAQSDFRGSGIWLMGETGDPRFLSVLARTISDPDPQVRALAFRAIAKLKQVAAKYPAQPNFRVHLMPAVSAAGVWKEASAAIWEQSYDGVQPVAGLKSTQFVLYEESRLVTHYEIRENLRTEGISIAFVLPRIPERDHPFHPYCEAAFGAALAQKRKCDSWLILKYLSENERAAPAASQSGRRIFQIDNVDSASVSETVIPSDARFLTEPEAILSEIESPGNRMLLPRSPLKAMESLTPLLSYCRGSRHLVFVCHPSGPGTDWERWQEVAGAAVSAHINIHVIAFEQHPDLVQFSARTGGSFMRLGGLDGFQAMLEGLCAGLVHNYSLRYLSGAQDEIGAAASLKIRVYRPGGFGEAALASEAYALPNAEVA